MDVRDLSCETKHICGLIHTRIKGEVGTMKLV